MDTQPQARPHQVPRHIIPGFLRRIDHYLLVHLPLVWRTRIHYFAFFSLILGNVLLFLLGSWYPVSQGNVPTVEQVNTLVAGFRLLGAMILLAWAYVQYCIPMGERHPRQYLTRL